MKVCMLLTNDFTHDSRVYREAKTLVENGYDLTVLALKSDNTLFFEQFKNLEEGLLNNQ